VWERWLPLTAERGRDAWAIELRGRNGSRPVPDLGRVRIAEFVRDVGDALDHIGPAVLVGHSMGGLLAQAVAASHPNVLAAAFLCSVPPRGIVALTGPLLRQAGAYLPAMAAGRAFAPRRADADALIMNEVAPPERDALFPRFVADSGTAAREIALGRFAVDRARVRVPVLVAGATHDRISPPALHRKLVRRYAAQDLVFEGRGHLIMLEDGWRGRAGLVLAWAERAAPPGSAPLPGSPPGRKIRPPARDRASGAGVGLLRVGRSAHARDGDRPRAGAARRRRLVGARDRRVRARGL
jgi:pimeloyl-ACP methyl ester carboxylesterase